MFKFSICRRPHLTSPDKLLPEKCQNIFRWDGASLYQNLLVIIRKEIPSRPRASFFSGYEFCK